MARLTITDLGNGQKLVEFSFHEEQGISCTDCGREWADQPLDFLRYDRWADAWVTKAEERDTVLPDHGVCKSCQDEANYWHDLNRYGGPNHAQVEQRIMEDERWVWAA